MAAHIEAVADAAPVLLRLAGPDGACTWVSGAWRRFRGRDAAAELGRGWTEGIHPNDLEGCLATYQGAVARGQGYEVEYRLRRADGRWRWVLERGRPADGGGGPSLVSATLDITERHRAQAELLRSREELRLALEAGSMGTWVWDRRTGEVSRDSHLHALYGLGPERSAGSFEEFLSLVHPDDRAHVQAEVERAMAEGGTYELEHRIVRPDGMVLWVERRGEAFFDESGAVAGTRGLVVDITARKEAEAERSRLLEAERQARRAAELAARRVAHLQAVTAGLADARTVADVAEVIVSQGATALDAASSALCVAAEDGDQLEVIRQVGYAADLVQRFRSFPLEAPLPASQCVRTGEMVLLRSRAERDARFPALAGTPTPNQSHAAVPLFVRGRPSGAIALGWTEQRDFDDGDRSFLLALAQDAGQALDRARFYESEQWRAERQAFLAEASRLLGSSLDYERTLEQVARLAVPPTADACSIHLCDDDGRPRLLAAVHRDPAKEDLMRGLAGAWCLSDDQLAGVVAGPPLLLQRVDDDQRGRAGRDGADPAALRQLATRSAVAVALRAQNEALGALVLGMDGERRYRPGDLAFVEDVAARAAAAISNGRAHRARTEIARSLQHSLLPPGVPVIPGVEVAARYHPLGDEVEVGGDFYDLFRADVARWGLVIGDASGKGVLAASLTALARYTVRTAARREPSASAVLELLNQSILDQEMGERFCTIALAFLGTDRGGVRFDVACGGHPLPLLVRPTGEVRPVGRPGTAMGLVEFPTLEDESHHLEPGEALVLFTDGMIEARSPDGTFGEGLLEATLAGCAGLSADAMADAVDKALIDFVGGRPRDDTALLVVRRPLEVFDLEILPEPRAVSVSRHLFQAWLDRQLAATPAVAEDLGLVATELVTNAARVARTGVQLHASADATAVTLDVSDDGPGFGGRVPVVTSTGATNAIVGPGLRIVGSLVDECAVESGLFGTVVRCVKRRAR